MTISPPVMYSQPFASHPSTTETPPEFLTANLSPAFPAANNFPDVAPYNTVFPTIVFSFVLNLLSFDGLTIIVPPDNNVDEKAWAELKNKLNQKGLMKI